MNKRTGLLLATVVVLGAAYVHFFTDWFKPRTIRIMYRSFPDPSQPVDPVTIYFGQQQKVTSIRIYDGQAKTNKTIKPFWEVVSATRDGVPMTDFNYGETISGLKPRTGPLTPPPLKSDGTYWIQVEAGKVLGEREFTPRGRSLSEE